MEVFQVVDGEGNTIKPWVFISHIVTVQALREDARKLSGQLSDFMHTVEHKLEALTRYRTPTLRNITYGSDYFTVQADNYHTPILGLSDRHRYVSTGFGVSY